MHNAIPFEDAAAILGRADYDDFPQLPLAPPTPPPIPPMRIPSPKIVGFEPEQIEIPPPIPLHEYFKLKRNMQRAQFKRDVLVWQREYRDLFAKLTIQRNALDERIQLIHRTVQQLRAGGIPISKQDLQLAERRLKQYEYQKQQVLRQLVFVDAHLQQIGRFMENVSRVRIRRR